MANILVYMVVWMRNGRVGSSITTNLEPSVQMPGTWEDISHSNRDGYHPIGETCQTPLPGFCTPVNLYKERKAALTAISFPGTCWGHEAAFVQTHHLTGDFRDKHVMASTDDNLGSLQWQLNSFARVKWLLNLKEDLHSIEKKSYIYVN